MFTWKKKEVAFIILKRIFVFCFVLFSYVDVSPYLDSDLVWAGEASSESEKIRFSWQAKDGVGSVCG